MRASESTPSSLFSELSLSDLTELLKPDVPPSPFLHYCSPLTSARLRREGKGWQQFLGPQPVAHPHVVAAAQREFETRLAHRYSERA